MIRMNCDRKIVKAHIDDINETMMRVIFESKGGHDKFPADYTLKKYELMMTERKFREMLSPEQLKVFEKYQTILEEKLREDRDDEE